MELEKEEWAVIWDGRWFEGCIINWKVILQYLPYISEISTLPPPTHTFVSSREWIGSHACPARAEHTFSHAWRVSDLGNSLPSPQAAALQPLKMCSRGFSTLQRRFGRWGLGQGRVQWEEGESQGCSAYGAWVPTYILISYWQLYLFFSNLDNWAFKSLPSHPRFVKVYYLGNNV